jgi:hypothetical protein
MKRALTLVEVILSTALLGMMSSVVLLFVVATLGPSKQAAYREQAVCLAQTSFEEARRLGVGNHTLPEVRLGEEVFRREAQVRLIESGLWEATVLTHWQNKTLVRKRRYCDASL